MMRLFDYIYYRWFKVYAKEDSDPDIYASGIVSAYQLLTIINLVLITSVIFDFEYPGEKYLYPLIIVFFIINYFRYERNSRISEFDDRWRNEPKKKKRLNMILLIAYLAITFITPWIYGFATN